MLTLSAKGPLLGGIFFFFFFWGGGGGGYSSILAMALYKVACNKSLEIQKTMVWQPCWMTKPFVSSSNMAAVPLSFWIFRE